VLPNFTLTFSFGPVRQFVSWSKAPPPPAGFRRRSGSLVPLFTRDPPPANLTPFFKRSLGNAALLVFPLRCAQHGSALFAVFGFPSLFTSSCSNTSVNILRQIPCRQQRPPLGPFLLIPPFNGGQFSSVLARYLPGDNQNFLSPATSPAD